MLQYAELGNFSLFLKPSYLPFSVGKFTRVRGYIPPPAFRGIAFYIILTWLLNCFKFWTILARIFCTNIVAYF